MITRREARVLAMQALFQMDVGHHTPETAIENVVVAEMGPSEQAYLQDMVTGTWNNLDALDRLIAAKAKNWDFERLGRVDRTVLRLALYEMGHRNDIPLAVSINEAIELAREYGDEDSAKFVNGILGSLTNGTETDERIDIEQLLQQAESVPGRRIKRPAAPPPPPEPPPADTPKVQDVGAVTVEKKPVESLRRILLKRPEDRSIGATVGKSRKETVLTAALDEEDEPAPRKRRASSTAATEPPAAKPRTRKKTTETPGEEVPVQPSRARRTRGSAAAGEDEGWTSGSENS